MFGTSRSSRLYLILVVVTLCGVGIAAQCVPSRHVIHRPLCLVVSPLLLAVIACCVRSDADGKAAAKSSQYAKWKAGVVGLLTLLCAMGGVLTAYGIDLLSFTYGDQDQVESLGRTLCWAVPLLILLAMVGWEWGLRQRLWHAFARRGLMWAIVLGVVASSSWIASGWEIRSVPFLLCSLVGVIALELSCTSLLVRTGDVMCGGVLRGTVMVMLGYVVSDWHGIFFTAYTYVTSGMTDYLLIGTGYMAALAVVAGGSTWMMKK